MYLMTHFYYDKLSIMSRCDHVEFCINGSIHDVYDIEGLLKFCNSAINNDGMATPFIERDFRISLCGPLSRPYDSDVEVKVGRLAITIGHIASGDLINDIKRCCMAALDFGTTLYAKIKIKEVRDGD